METWIEVENFPDYEVSNLWKVRLKKTGYVLKLTFKGKAGAVVYLMKEGKPYTRSLSKIVIAAFAPKKR